MACNVDLVANDIAGDFPIDPTSVVVSNVSAGLTVTNNLDGTVTVSSTVPGTYTFEYEVYDTMGNVSNTATVTVEITAVIPPMAVNDQFSGPGASLDILANDIPGSLPLDPTCVVVTNVDPSIAVTTNPDGTVDVQGITGSAAWETSTLQDGAGNVVINDPVDICISPDGSTAYVSSTADGAIYAVDTATGAVSTLTAALPGVTYMSMHRTTGDIIAISPGTYVPGNVGNGMVWRITPAGVVTVVEATAALPGDVAINDTGDIYLGERWDFGGGPNVPALTRIRNGVPATSPTELFVQFGLLDHLDHLSFSDDLTLQVHSQSDGHYRFTIEPGYTTHVQEVVGTNASKEHSYNGDCYFVVSGARIFVQAASPLLAPLANVGGDVAGGTVDGPIGTSRFEGISGWEQHSDGRLFVVQNNNGLIRVVTPEDSTFDYTVCDTSANVSNVATVSLPVSCPTEGPIAGDDSFALSDSSPTIVNVAGNDDRGTWAIDRSLLTTSNVDPSLTVVAGPSWGEFTVTPSVSGTYTFDYTLTDTEGNSTTATVTINALVPVARDADEVPHLVEWLDASAIPPVADLTQLTTWPAVIGNDAIGPVPASVGRYRTAEFNGFPAIEYVGNVNHRHTFASPFAVNPTEFTVVLAFEDYDAAQGTIIGNRSGAAGGFNLFVNSNGVRDNFFSYTPTNSLLAVPDQAGNVPTVMAIRTDATGKQLFQQMTQVASNAQTFAMDAGAAWNIAGEPAVGGNWYFRGLIAEIAVYDEALTDQELLDVLLGMKTKYSV